MHLFNSAVHQPLEAIFGPIVSAFLTEWRLGFESFFLMAGFFLAHSFREDRRKYLSVPKFAQRRLTRLAIPFWCAIVLAYLDHLLPNVLLGHHNELPSTRALLAEVFFLTNMNGSRNLSLTFWSMSVMIQIYMMWIATFWVVRRVVISIGIPDFHRATERVMSVLNMLAAMVGAVVFVKFNMPLNTLCSTLLFTGLGATLYWGARTHVGWLPFLATLAIDVTLGVMTGNSRFVTVAISALILYVLAQGVKLPETWPVRILRFFGHRSYSIYLTHTIVGFRITNMANHLNVQSPQVAVAVFLAAIAGSLAFACVFYRFVELPVQRWVSRSSYRG